MNIKKEDIQLIIWVLILSTVPISIYANSWNLVIDSIFDTSRSAGFLWYLKPIIPELLTISFFFAIWTLPIIIKYHHTNLLSCTAIWFIFVSLWLLIVRCVWQPLYMLYNYAFVPWVFVTSYLLIFVFWFVTTVKVQNMLKFYFTLMATVLSIILSLVFWWLEFVWTWWWIPIFKMLTIILRHVIISLGLCYIAIRFNDPDAQMVHKWAWD